MDDFLFGDDGIFHHDLGHYDSDGGDYDDDYATDSGDDMYHDPSAISFHGSTPPHPNIDGYIPDGKVTLTSVGGNHKTFDLYSKGGNDYIYKNGWIKINGSGLVTIDHIQYHKIN